MSRTPKIFCSIAAHRIFKSYCTKKNVPGYFIFYNLAHISTFPSYFDEELKKFELKRVSSVFTVKTDRDKIFFNLA